MKQRMILGIPVEIEKKRIKNMYLRLLPPEGRVHISAPTRVKEDQIEQFVASRYHWIIEHQTRLQNRRILEEHHYISGEIHYFRGKPYQLEVVPGTKEGIELCKEQLVMTTKKDSTDIRRKKILDDFYRAYLLQWVPLSIRKWEGVIGVRSDQLVIRDMKTRWGTCNIREKKITINLQLAKKPDECLEYVIVHELVHLLEASHNHIFKGYMNLFLPQWKGLKAELNGKILE